MTTHPDPDVPVIETETDEEREVSASFGMWVFLVSEGMLFGGLVLAFLAMRLRFAPTFGDASDRLSLPLGTLNTAVLLTSSLLMAEAHKAAERGEARTTRRFLAFTAVLGTVFLGIKGTEWLMEASEGLAPVLGLPFHWDGEDAPQAALFFRFYFGLTALHAVHLITGIGIILATFLILPRRDPAGRERWVRGLGLYWHFVDVVWVFLFPFLYLIQR
ncbi:Cytochrome c oxidase polypeptide III [Rubellimicrobium mesophilum DSM 19309]|uniref:Cytochrome c oxidase polypeptide III n=1 Tax=Rubellimicrobium mesophilum DSM 19309 TaxID=442562 RepID=A0A017HHF1_9RHOB|nr:cytochrome c oxidase subunit 3 [Rubellimicrobium mesophilum]EYD73932.1 Cytochrome c oxidase polypeptide III [Rubellimicrobium mesophilum DSM 19309]